MARTLEPAMRSEHEEEAARLAAECARTLLAYYRSENDEMSGWLSKRASCEATWSDHKDAVDRFEQTFPCHEWRDFAEKAMLAAIEEAQP